jgi:hypothetical protein
MLCTQLDARLSLGQWIWLGGPLLPGGFEL